jgi:hypothetical protein
VRLDFNFRLKGAELMPRTSPATTHAPTVVGKTPTRTLSIFLLLSLILSSALPPRGSEATALSTRESPSKDDDVEVRVEREEGVYRVIFNVKGVGTDYVNFPDDMPPGGVISGTVFAVPDGAKDVAAKNRKALENYTVEVDDRKISAGQRVFHLTLPPASRHASVAVRLLDNKGKAVAEESVAVSSRRPEQPKDFSFPHYTQSGQFLSVACPCDGVIADDDFIKVGETQILTLAKSSGQVAALNTSEVVGPTDIVIRERGQVRKGTTRNISLRITADDYALLKGQRTKMHVAISGLDGLNEVLHWRLRNYSTNVLTMSGGDEQELDIRPEDVRAGGVYTAERILTGITVGAFFIEGVINWKQPEEGAAVGRQTDTAAPQGPPSQPSDGFATQWPRNSVTQAEADEALKKWQESLPEPKAPENPPLKVRAAEPTPAMFSKLAAVLDSDDTLAAMVDQQFDAGAFTGAVYSAVLTHRYLTAETEHKRRVATGARKESETQWREAVGAIQKSFALAGLIGLSEERLSQFAKNLADDPRSLKAVAKLADGARMEEESSDDKPATAPLAQFVAATAKVVGPADSLTVKSPCDAPLSQGSLVKHFGGSFSFTVRLQLPCIPKFWKLCWYNFKFGASYGFDINIGYKVTCCGVSAWGIATAQACANVGPVKLCAGCTGAIVGVAGLGKIPSSDGGSCVYGLGVNASLNCKVAGVTVFTASTSWGWTIKGPCPPERVPCR